MSPQVLDSAGLHVRAGNSMRHTRDAVLDGALDCLVRSGAQQTTMGAISLAGGVAKATLYNHFRTKHDVWVALVDRELRRIADAAAGLPDPAARLTLAGRQVGRSSAVRALADHEPASLLPLLAVSSAKGWDAPRRAVASLVACEWSDPRVDISLRWLVSQLLSPQPLAELTASAQLLTRLAPTPDLTSVVQPVLETVDRSDTSS